MNDTILISDIIVEDRIRTDLGDIDKLCDSIKEFGIIQPIVLNKYDTETGNGLPFTGTFLIAGGRRLVAMKRLGIKELEHGKHFVWRDEYDPLRRKAVELEENIRRKELTWQEQLDAKQRLFDLMQQIHGKPITGRPRISDNSGGVGFGINKLASMLGESVGTTSTDLKIARAIQQMPQLRFSQTKAQAITTLGIIATAGNMAVAGKAVPKTEKLWQLYEGHFMYYRHITPDNSVDLVWTDLPYGSDVDKMSQHTKSVATFDDSIDEAMNTIIAVATESYRVLKDDRYACFCFGFRIYNFLCQELTRVGFNVVPVPVIWVKNTKSGENPRARYGNSYEPILVVCKGNPSFIRPGQSNVIQIPVETRDAKLQTVQKPVDLVQRFLLDMCAPGALIVDWCCGTGTTGVAATKLGMRSILFEKEKSMYELAKLRLESI